MTLCEGHVGVDNGRVTIPLALRSLVRETVNLIFVPKEGFIAGWPSLMSSFAPSSGTIAVAVEFRYRMNIPHRLMQLAGITDTVVFVGGVHHDGYFEIWSEKGWQQQLELYNKMVEHWQSVIARSYVID